MCAHYGISYCLQIVKIQFKKLENCQKIVSLQLCHYNLKDLDKVKVTSSFVIR
jgi:hypothetical protein